MDEEKLGFGDHSAVPAIETSQADQTTQEQENYASDLRGMRFPSVNITKH